MPKSRDIENYFAAVVMMTKQRGEQKFSAVPERTAFEAWWSRHDKKLRGKALAKAAFDAAIQEMCT